MWLLNRESFLRVLAIPIIAVGLSSISLWLLESPLKFPLFIFEVALIFFLCQAYLEPSPWQFSVKDRGVSTILDYLSFAASLTLLLLVVFDSYSIVNQILAIAVCFFLPGYTLLRFIRFRSLHTWIEKLVLSMLLSIPISGLIYTIMLIAVPSHGRAITLASVYLFIALLLVLRNVKLRRSRVAEEPYIYSASLADTALLLVIVAFIVYVLSVTYPQMSYYPGTDIVRHFSTAQVIDTTPAISNLPYPWFHFQWAQVQVLAGQPINIFQSSIVYLTLIVVLSFYIMAKAYLRNIDRRLPILSTVFFSVFSGFGWVYFLREKLATTDLSANWPIVANVNDIAYWDLMYGGALQLWLWYRPWTLGVALLMVLLYLLKRQDLTRRNYLLLCSPTVVALGIMHLPELVSFIGILLVLSLFTPKIELGLRKVILSALIGVSAIAALEVLYRHVLGIPAGIPYTHLAGLGAALLVSYGLSHCKGWQLPGTGTKINKVIVLLAALVYVALLITWLSSEEPFSAAQVSESLSVPWMLYPVLLGIGGLLGLGGLVWVTKEHRGQPVVVFVHLFIIALVIGVLVDYLNVKFFATGYWERRMIILIHLALSVLAALALTKVIQVLSGQTFKQFSVPFIVGIIVICGFNSTLLVPEYWQYRIPREVIDEDVLNTLNNASRSLGENPQVAVWTVSDRSRSEAQFLPVSWVVKDLRDQLWSSRYPEMALNLFLYEGVYPPPYIYLHARDLNILNKDYPDSYMVRHFLSYSLNISKGAEAGVYQSPELTAPRPQSDVALLIPATRSDSDVFAYDMLSLGGCDYTTYLESDPNPKGEIFIVPNDHIFNLRKLLGKKVIIMNINGYGHYSGFALEAKSRFSLSFNDSPSDAFFHLSQDYPAQLTLLEAAYPFNNELEFIIDNDAEENAPLILGDDDQVSFWQASAYGDGNIGIPVLANEPENKLKGNDSLHIEVGEGKYLVPQLMHIYENPQDWSSYDFISFYWYGYGDNRRYVFDILCPNDDRFYYTFWDTWEGWRRVILPLRVRTGTHEIAGVTISKAVLGEPSWSKINKIRVTQSLENKDLTGAWFLDRLTLDTGKLLTVSLEVSNLPLEHSPPALSVYDGTSYIDIPLSSDGKMKTIPNTQLRFLDGSEAESFYGENHAGTIKVEPGQESYTLTLSVKLPPDLADDSASSGISQFKVRVGLAAAESRSAVGIVSDKGKLIFQKSLPITQLRATDGFETVAEYICEGGERIPLAVESIIDGVEVTYLNVYPLVQQWAAEDEFGARAYSSAKDLLRYIGLSLPEGTYGETLSYVSKLMFKEAVLDGSVEIVSPSIIFSQLSSDTSIQVESEETTIYYAGVVSVEIEGAEKVTLYTTSGIFTPGIGFYARLCSGESITSADGKDIVLSLELADGRSIDLSVGSHLEFKIQGNYEVLLRTPQVSVVGEARFTSAYVYEALDMYPRVLGQDLMIEGHIEFSLPLSDTYSMAQDFTWSGSRERDPPVYQRPEGQDFKNALPWTLILFVFAIFCYMIYQSGRTREEKDSNSSNRRE